MPHDAISSALSLRMGENFLRNSSPKAARKISSVLERFLAAVSGFFLSVRSLYSGMFQNRIFLNLICRGMCPTADFGFFGFGVRCGLRIFRFLASGFRFS